MTATITQRVPATVGVVGLGPTGLPLALALAGSGLLTIGFDLDRARITALREGCSYLGDVTADELADTADWFEPTAEPGMLAGLDAYVICVPAPPGADRADVNSVDDAADTVAPLIRRGSLVVLQSPVPPGAAAGLADRLAAGSGLRAGVDFHVATAPGPAPADGDRAVRDAPEVVGELTPECARQAAWLVERVAAAEPYGLPAGPRVRASVVVDRLAELLRDEESDLSGARVLVAGAACGPGSADVRDSPALDIVRELRRRAAKPSYADPLVTELVVDGEPVDRVDWRVDWRGDHVSEFDGVVLVTPHAELMGAPLWSAAPLVLDTWHVLPAGDGVHHL
jgi:UDP-N-acetyl-D-mannosaminuronate dehydrogenase